jgi:hypothetical protein
VSGFAGHVIFKLVGKIFLKKSGKIDTTQWAQINTILFALTIDCWLIEQETRSKIRKLTESSHAQAGNETNTQRKDTDGTNGQTNSWGWWEGQVQLELYQWSRCHQQLCESITPNWKNIYEGRNEDESTRNEGRKGSYNPEMPVRRPMVVGNVPDVTELIMETHETPSHKSARKRLKNMHPQEKTFGTIAKREEKCTAVQNSAEQTCVRGESLWVDVCRTKKNSSRCKSWAADMVPVAVVESNELEPMLTISEVDNKWTTRSRTACITLLAVRLRFPFCTRECAANNAFFFHPPK